MEWFKGFAAVLTALTFTACFIGVLHYTSFEQNHTHDWPSNQTLQAADNQSDVRNPKTNEVKPLSPHKPSQSTGAYPNDNSLQHYDHKAQIIMAFATLLGLAIALGGLILIWRTLSATKIGTKSMQEALIEAKDSTKAAWEAVDVTRDIGRKQVRAYVTFDKGHWYVEKDSKVLRLCIFLKNYGQSPSSGGSATVFIDLTGPNSNQAGQRIQFVSNASRENFGVVDCNGSTPCQFSFSNEGIKGHENLTNQAEIDWIDTILDHDFDVSFSIVVKWLDVFGDNSVIEFMCSKDQSRNDHEPNKGFRKTNRFEHLSIYTVISRT